jgi:hypothetical protein
MDVGFLLPYLLLVLVLLDEHCAMWLVYFFMIPLLDVMFFVEIPKKECIKDHWNSLCMKMWFPLMLYVSLRIECSYRSMISIGILYNSSLCLSDELNRSDRWFDNLLGVFISDFLGFVYFDNLASILSSVGCQYTMLLHDRLMWHLGGVFICSVMYEYVNWIENKIYRGVEVSHYGLGNYTMFRLRHSNAQLIPTSHMWVLPYLQLRALKIE